MPGQEKALKDYKARKESGHDEKLSLALLFEAGFQSGQTVFAEVMAEGKASCPICGNNVEVAP